jgi:hypothetical protein
MGFTQTANSQCGNCESTKKTNPDNIHPVNKDIPAEEEILIPSWAQEDLNSWMNMPSNIKISSVNEGESWIDKTGMYSLYHANKWSEKGVYYPYNPEDEVFDSRTRDTKTFRNEDGTFTAIFLAGLHYKDEYGNWRDIDLSIEENYTGYFPEYELCNTKNSFQTYFSNRIEDGFVIKKDNNSIKLGLNPIIDVIESNGNSNKHRLSTPTVSQSDRRVLNFTDIISDVDFEMVMLPSGVESGYILKNADWLNNTVDEKLVFSQEIELPDGWYIEDEGKRKKRNFSAESFNIIMPDGSDGIRFKPVIVFDGKISRDEVLKQCEIPIVKDVIKNFDKPVKDEYKESKYFAEYDIVVQGDKLIVSYEIPVSWLKSQDRTYPVYIDPTVEILTSYTQSSSTLSGMPYNTYYHDQRYDFLVLASDLTAVSIPNGALITGMGMYCYQTAGQAISNFRIRTQATSATTLSSWITSGWTVNYGPSYIGTPSGGNWYDYTFSSNYSFNSSNNILFNVSRDNTGWTSGGGNYLRGTIASRAGYGYSDSGYTWPYDGMTFTAYAYLPSMRITYSAIDCGNTNSGSISPSCQANTVSYSSGTIPYWSFYATAGRTYHFSLGSNPEDSYLRLYNSNYVQQTSNDDNGPFASGVPASLSWTCSSSGTYYISAAHFSCNNFSNSGSMAYWYTTAPYASSGGTITPNTSWQNQAYTAGNVYWYRFSATINNVYDFSLCSNSEDSYLRIYDQNWNYITHNDDNGDHCSGLPASIQWTCPATGSYIIQISNFSCDGFTYSGNMAYRRCTPNAPSPVSSSPSTICSGSSSNLNATSSGNTIRWYTASSGGTLLGTSSSGANFSVSPTSTTTYYAESLSSGNGCTSLTRTPVTVTVDNTNPTYGGYANISGYQYYDGTSYWVKGGNVLTVDITHSDNVSVWMQYFGFNHNNCTPNNCGGAPDEIKSYTTMGSFADWLANDSYLNITSASVIGGAWGSTTVTNRWSTTFSSSCPDWDWYMYTYLYDWCTRGVGYTALGKWVKVDNTAPTRDEATVNNSCWDTDGSNTYTITIKSTEPRSGFGGSYGMMALVNYNLGEPSGGGYFAWHPSSYVHSDNQMACTGGGYVSKASNWGGSRIDLVSATTSVSGNQRTVTFTVRPHSNYLERDGDNKISMYTSDNCSNNSGWTLFDVNFTTTRVPLAPTGTTTICVGGSATLTRGNAPPAGVTYYWQTSASGTSTSIGSGATLVVSPGTTTTYYVRPYSSSGCWGQASSGVTVTVVSDPSITASGSNTICTGGSASLSSSTTGGTGTLSYQWQSSPNGSSSWTNISGATSATYNPTNITSTTYYRVLLSATGSGCGTAQTNTVTVNVVADPAITTQPVGGTICTGGSITLSMAASGGTPSLTYQWYRNGSSISGATNPSYAATTAGTYYCIASASGSGCGTAQTNTVTVTVVADPAITTQPVGGTICTGGSITLSMAASGGTPSLTYQWYRNGSSISGATNTSYAATTAGTYYCIASASGSGCGTAQTNTVTVTVVADPSITASGSNTICTGGSASLSSSTTGGTGTLSYQWQSSPNGSSSWTNISGATSATYNPTNITSTTYYRVLLSATGSGCGTAQTNTVTVNVVADPAITTQPVGGTICTGGSITLSMAASGGTPSLTYQWYRNGSSISGATNPSYAATTAGTYYCIASASGSGCGTAQTNTVTVTVVADPAITTQPVGGTICTGGSITLSMAASGGTPSLTYQWYRNGSSISGATNTSYAATTAGTYYCIASASGSGCGTAQTNTVTVTVVADPVAQTVTGTPVSGTDICLGGQVSATFSGGSGGTGTVTDNYQYSTNGGSSWSTYTPGNNLTSVSTGTNEVQIRTWRTASGSGCGTSGYNTAQWTVVADPSVTASGSTSICSGHTANLSSTGSNGTGSTSYQWQIYDGSSWSNISGATNSTYTTDVLTATTQYRVLYSATGLGCGTATSNTVTITVDNPSITGVNSGDYIWTGNASTEWNNTDNWLQYDGTNFSVAVTVPTSDDNILFRDYGTACVSNSPFISSASGTCNNITIESGLTVTMSNNQTLNVSGDWNNSGTFTAGNGHVVFNGASQQTIESGGSAFNDVTFANQTSGINDIIVSEPMTINGQATFQFGIVNFAGTGSLSFGSGASSSIGSSTSYVNGVISKTGNTAFTFAVGEGTVWAPVAIAAPAEISTISAEYNHTPGPVNWTELHTCTGSDLKYTSGVEHWELTSDRSYPAVTLYWRTTASGIQDLPDLTVAHWNGTCWENKGGSAVGNNAQGFITSSVAFTSYSPITFGTKTFDNPLPVELVSFTGICDNNNVLLEWQTASETNNDRFVLQRSSDMQEWEDLSNISGAGNTNENTFYDFTDRNPLKGESYYRLKQIDFNGEQTIHNIINVNCEENDGEEPVLTAYPNPFNKHLFIEVSNWDTDILYIEIFDLLGKKLGEWKTSGIESLYRTEIDMSNIAPAMYVIKARTAKKVIVKTIEKN